MRAMNRRRRESEETAVFRAATCSPLAREFLVRIQSLTCVLRDGRMQMESGGDFYSRRRARIRKRKLIRRRRSLIKIIASDACYGRPETNASVNHAWMGG